MSTQLIGCTVRRLLPRRRLCIVSALHCTTPSSSSCVRSVHSSVASPRAAATAAGSEQTAGERKMGAWQVHAYGDVRDELLFSDRVNVPVIRDANEVLVRVLASSLNAIDVEMARGRGASTFNALRRCSDQHSIEFPLTLGRDFVGVVAHRGMSVRDAVAVGERVWGTVPFHRAGCHAEFCVVDANNLSAAPASADDAHAAAVLYAGLTAWSGLFISGQLGGLAGATTALGGGRGRRVCILGASGGVGHLAAQICRAEAVEVVATCATDACEMVRDGAGVGTVIDYCAADAEQRLVAAGPYDLVLDCAGKGAEYAAALDWQFGQYVTFTSPVLGNNDEWGLVGGTVRNVMDLVAANWRSVTRATTSKTGTTAGCCGGLVKWAYVAPLPHGVEYLRRLVEEQKLTPVVEQTFDFKDADKAYARLCDGHLRGKIVLKM